MYFYLTGIDYKSAPIGIRDAVYGERKAIAEFVTAAGGAMLITCNRLEIYGVAACADDAFGDIGRFARAFPDFARYAYSKYGERAVFRHALRLAAGLESQIKGEWQILEQLSGWRRLIASPPLGDLWYRAIAISRNIRIASGIGEDGTDIAALVFDDIRERLGAKNKYRIVIVGTGKVAGLFAKRNIPGAHLSFAAHKNFNRAEGLAGDSGGEALYLNDLAHVIAKTDVLICASSSPHHIIGDRHLGRSLGGRKSPLYIYDLSTPRGVDPWVTVSRGVYLQNLDDLSRIFSRYNESVRDRVESASGMVEDILEVYGGAIHDRRT